MRTKIQTVSSENGIYSFANGHSMSRELESKTPNGCRMAGRWALRDKNNQLVDFDQYSNDIAERQNLDLYNLIH